MASIMLEDSAEIQRDDAAFVSKKCAKQGLPPVKPLYIAQDADKAVRQFVGINYGRPFPVADGITVTFRDAGHILGAAQVVFDIRENGRKFRYLFSGDIGRGNDDILRDPQLVENVDYLQVESPYGAREHSSKANANAEVGQMVRETLDRNGGFRIHSHRTFDSCHDRRPANLSSCAEFCPGARHITAEHDLRQFASAGHRQEPMGVRTQ